MNKRKIPIKNIYYMLTYAWDVLDEADEMTAGMEKFDHIYELLSRIYIEEVRRLIRRGFTRSYKEVTEETGQIRGKINISLSLNEQTLRRRKMICHVHTFTEDNTFNQIVKATLLLLMRVPSLTRSLQKQLHKLTFYFTNVSDISLTSSDFRQLRFHSLNNHYRLLIHVSKLLVDQLLATEKGSDVQFRHFIENELVAHVFEKFVYNFYRRHLPMSEYKVRAPHIEWRLTDPSTAEALQLLPVMRTDIVVEDKKKRLQQIIDTKFYKQTLVSGYRSQHKKLQIDHLYQLFAYVQNSMYDGEVKGLLLYPKTDRSVRATYEIMEREMSVVTLNLYEDWPEIESQLLSFIE